VGKFLQRNSGGSGFRRFFDSLGLTSYSKIYQLTLGFHTFIFYYKVQKIFNIHYVFHYVILKALDKDVLIDHLSEAVGNKEDSHLKTGYSQLLKET